MTREEIETVLREVEAYEANTCIDPALRSNVLSNYWRRRLEESKALTEPVPYKFGARWIVDGPNGRFHARTKAEALRLLRDSGGLLGNENGETGEAKRLQDVVDPRGDK